MKALKILLVLVGISFLVGCNLPEETLKSAEATKQGLESAKTAIEDMVLDYKEAKESESFSFFATYAEREKWEDSFTEAKKELKQAESIYRKDALPILTKNSIDDDGKLKKALKRIQKKYRYAVEVAKKPQQRKEEIKKYRAEAPQILREAKVSLKNAEKALEIVKKTTDQAIIDYPERKKDVDGMVAVFNQKQKKAKEALSVAETEFAKIKKKELVDFAVFGDNIKIVDENTKFVNEEGVKYKKRIEDQFYNAYSKIIIDMKEKPKYWVVYVKYAWDNYYDHDTTREASREKEYVSQVKYEEIIKRLITEPEGFIINRRDESELWIEDADIEETYFHKYTIIKNGKKEDTDWIEVDEAYYEDYYDYLGMEIVSKPYGCFEEEKLTDAMPPGMAVVGNSKHGEWKTNPQTGNSFWHYYGIYAFLNAGRHNQISRDDYNNWNRNYRNNYDYYGRTKSGMKRWGTEGVNVRTSAKYQNTHFAKIGGLRSAPVSAKGLSGGMRGGGPGGGGK